MIDEELLERLQIPDLLLGGLALHTLALEIQVEDGNKEEIGFYIKKIMQQSLDNEENQEYISRLREKARELEGLMEEGE